MQLSDYDAYEADFFSQLKTRHPHRKSEVGVLVAEITSGEDLARRSAAAHIYGVRKYRRGYTSIKAAIDAIWCVVEQKESWVPCPETRLLSALLIASGNVDTRESHSLLLKVLAESRHAQVRGDALEAMAFEDHCFELELVCQYAAFHAEVPEILSAVYALEFHGFAGEHPEQARNVLCPLLSHIHPMVRVYAVRALSFNSSNRNLILALKDDPEAHVRTEVKEAVRVMNN